MDHKLKIRSKKYLRGAEEQSCVRCGKKDRTIVAAHYTGLRSHIYGKGTGTKCHDVLSADLCHECHQFFDNPEVSSLYTHRTERIRHYWKIEMSEEFLNCVALTLIRRCEQGIIYTDDMSLGGK